LKFKSYQHKTSDSISQYVDAINPHALTSVPQLVSIEISVNWKYSVKNRRWTDQCCHHKLKRTNKLAIVFSHVPIHQLCAKPRIKVGKPYKSTNVMTRLFHKAENTTAAKSSKNY
jgi:hypothetical protein